MSNQTANAEVETEDVIDPAILLDAAHGLAAEDCEGAINILREAHAGRLNRADFAAIMQAIKIATGQPMRWIEAANDDASRFILGFGVINSSDDAAQAVYNQVGGDTNLLSVGNNIYNYEDNNTDELSGIWTRVDSDELKGILARGLPPAVVPNEARLDEIIRRLAVKSRKPKGFADAATGLAFRSQFLRVDPTGGGVELVDHAPEHKALQKLPFEYQPDATCPIFEAGLRRVFEADTQALDVFLTFVACALLRVRLRHDDVRRGLILLGPPRSGKSTLLSVVRSLFSPSVLSSVSPARWNKPEALTGLVGCQLNTQTELSATTKLDPEAVKKLLSGEPVEARWLHQNAFEFSPSFFSIWATNSMPRFNGAHASLIRRFIILRMAAPLSDSEVETDFTAVVQAEMPGVINLLLARFRSACETGRFQLPDDHEALAAELIHGPDIAARFVRTHVESRSGHRLSSRDLQAALNEYARDHGVPEEDIHAGLCRRASEAMARDYGATRHVSGGRPYYRNVALRAGNPHHAAVRLEDLE